MNSRPARILALVPLLFPLTARALTDTWDGGDGASNNLNVGANWVDNTAPASDLVNTDLIFAGLARLTPNVSAAFSTDSVLFNNTAGAFTFSGTTLNVGTGGITNNDANTQTFGNAIGMGLVTSATINAAAGPISFGNVFTAPTTLTVDGGFATTFSNITSSGSILKQGAGTMSWTASAATDADVTVSAGTMTLTGATTFNTPSALAVNGTSTLNINQGATLDGAQLTRVSGATLALAAGETLTVQNGGDAIFTGTFTNSTASTIAVSDPGSTLSTTSTLSMVGGSTLNVAAGGDVTSGAGTVTIGGSVGNGTVSVDGSGSSLGGGNLNVGLSGAAGLLTFSNGGSGAFGVINVDNSVTAGSSGTLNIQSGATVTGTSLFISNVSAVNNGAVTIGGAGSALTLSGGATIGATSGSVATLNVNEGGILNTGTASTTVNATGSIVIGSIIIGGATFNANGDFTLNGGQLTRGSSAVVFNLAAGRTFTVQNGGDANFTGPYSGAANATYNVTGAGSTFSATGGFQFDAGAVADIGPGALLSSGAAMHIALGIGAASSVTVHGAGAALTAAGTSTVGASSGSSGTLTFSDDATGTFSNLHMITNAALNIQSGADVTLTSSLGIGDTPNAVSAIATVTGAGSTLTVNGGLASDIGENSGSIGALNVNSGAVFTRNNGNMNVHSTGTIAIAGGTYNSNDNLTLNGGQLTRVGTGILNLAPGTQMTVQAGGDAIITGLFQQLVRANLNVTGGGSTFSTAGDFQWEGANNTLSFVSVNNGGVLSSGGSLHLGRNNTAVALTVSGAGSQLSANPFFTSEWQAGVNLSSGATATLGGVRLADADFGTDSQGSLNVQSGATVSLASLSAASVTADATATITVDGTGSAITQTGASTLKLGAAFVSSATLNVNNGGTFTSGTGAVTLNATSTVNIDGGTLSLNGPLTDNGGTVNLTSGALNIVSDFTIGTGGLLGDGDFTLPASKQFRTTGATTIDAFKTLTLDGGTFRTGTLTNNGTLAFNSGTLGITGAGGFNIGTGALGASVTLRDGARLDVTNTATVQSGATLRGDGGSLTAGLLNVFGTVRADRGSLAPNALQIHSGGRVFVADTIACATAASSLILTGGRLTLENGTGLVSGPGLIANSGLLTGDGTISQVFINQSSGEVRAESGKAIYLTAGTGTNDGRYNLQGGTLVFASGFTNGTPGQINGHGELYFPATPVPSSGAPAAGLNNSGTMNLSGGDSLIFGTVAVNGAGKVIASGGATATFFDVFRHSGAEVKASAGSALVFFGEVRGPGSFTGSGIIYMEGGYSPGASPASVTIAPQIVFTESNTLTLEIGGLTAGTQHDQLTFTHASSPQVTWGGTLVVELSNAFTPAAGHSFDVFDFDAARDAGTFFALNLPSLPAGLSWDTTQLYTTGVISVLAVPGLTFAAWAAASGLPGALPNGDHDSDGYDNAAEFALGLFPPQPGATEPTGGFHPYIEGERLRLLFTRPLDRTGVTITVQASADLLTWEDLATSVNSAPFTGPGFVSENRAHPLSEPGLVEVRDILTVAAAPRRQLRLRIDIVP